MYRENQPSFEAPVAAAETPAVETVSRPEEREREKVAVGLLSARELYDRVFKRDEEGVLQRDPRFADFSKGGRLQNFDSHKLAHFINTKKDDLFYVAAEEEGTIVGLSELERTPSDKDLFWMTFAAVDPDWRGKHISTKMIEETMRFAKEHGYAIEMSSYSDDGWERLRANYAKLAKQYGVKLIDKEKRL